MEPEQTPTPAPVPEPELKHSAHTFQDDLSKAMGATEVREVQVMLSQARAQEAQAVVEVVERKEKKWYSTASTLLIFITLGVIAYGTYYYMNLTVPLQPAVSVGVFTNTEPIATKNTTIQEVLTSLATSATLTAGKPILLNLVTDTQSNVQLTNSQLYTFIGANLTEPLQAAFSTARVGVVNTGKDILPFIIASAPDPERASNELSIAEPTLYDNFSLLLRGVATNATDLPPGAQEQTQQEALSELVANQQQTAQVSTPTVTAPTVTTSTFQSQYFYNLPVRSLTAIDSTTGEKRIVFLYGYANNNVVVIASTPEVLKAVYDTLITQI